MPGYRGRLRISTDDAGINFSYERELREPKRRKAWSIAWRMGAVVGLATLAFNVMAADEDGGPIAQASEQVIDALHMPVPEHDEGRTGVGVLLLLGAAGTARFTRRTMRDYADQRREDIAREQGPSYTMEGSDEVFVGELLPPAPGYKTENL